MRWAFALVAILLLSGAAVPSDAAPPEASGPGRDDGPAPAAAVTYTPHPGVRIDPDTPRTIAGRYNPATGIVAGSGTPADPYIIEGWSFHGGAAGLVVPLSLGIEIYRNHGGNTFADPGGRAGDHIVIRNNLFQDIGTGIRIHGSRHLTIEDNLFRGVTGIAIHHEEDHFHYLTNDIHLRDNDIETAGYGVRLDQVGGNIQDYDVTRNRIQTGANGVGVFVRNIHTGTIVVSDNDVRGGKVGIQSVLNKALTVEHNQVQDTGFAGVLLQWSTAQVSRNTLAASSVGLRLENNLATSRIADNAIAGNTIGLIGSAGDATGNWWGAADGPGGDGGGSGDPAYPKSSTTPISPWLSSAPADAGPRP